MARKKRIPLGVRTQKLSVDEGIIPENMVGRWINDDGDRINQAVAAGYVFVEPQAGLKVGSGKKDGNTDIGTRISKVVGTNKSNEPMRAYLMAIKKEWYDEDQAEKQKRVDSVDSAIRRGGFGADKKGLDKQHSYCDIDYKA